jgi:protein SCO1/2
MRNLVRNGLILAVAALAAFGCTRRDAGDPAAVAARLGLAGSVLSAPLERPDFVLTDTAGARFDFRTQTAGTTTLLFFGYTHCPDVCPGHLAAIADGLRAAPPEVRERVRVVFVGVDATRDTPERMRAWLDHFDDSFIGLTGSEEELAAAQTAALVPSAFVDATWEGGYTVAHAAHVLVYTPDDQAHIRYAFGTDDAAWTHDLPILAEGWPST